MQTPMQATLQVGLLLCDDVDESAHAQHGTYTEMFTRGLRAADANLALTPIRCDQNAIPDSPDAFDAFLISGSRRAAYEERDWIARLREFVRECYHHRKKTVGICFGHQLIAHALGGETRKADRGWGFGVHRAQITEPQSWMRAQDVSNAKQPPRGYNLVVIHQDQVTALPPNFRAIANNAFCPVSMLIDNAGRMLGIQGHPEFDKNFCAYRLDRRKDQLTAAAYRRARASLAQLESDSAEVFRWIARFIRA